MPATGATNPEGETVQGEAWAGLDATSQSEQQPQAPADGNAFQALHHEFQDLKLSQTMACDMVRSQGEELTDRMDKELADQSKSIGALRSRLYGGAGEPSVMEDVQMIIDVMRRDLNSQRELLMMVNEQIPQIREDVTSLRRDSGGSAPGGSGGGMRAQPANMSGYVTLQQHEQAFGALHQEMKTLHKATEMAAVKAGFLAVASSECSLEEKGKLFDTLKAKEEALHRTEDGALFDQGGAFNLSLENAYRSAVALQAMPPSGALTSANAIANSMQQGAIEFTVRVDKSAGDPLGLQIDHGDGSTLIIDAVHGGLIQMWNQVNPDLAVLPRDRIIAVNGLHGNADMLLRQTEQKQVLSLVVQRSSR